MINVVVGPPVAGKSEYVKAHAKDGNVVVDYDLIAKAMGSRVAHNSGGSVRIVALESRKTAIERILRGLDDAAWIIHTNPQPDVIQAYVDKDAKFTLLDPGKNEVLRRARASGRPASTIDAIEAWYANPPAIPNAAAKKDMGAIMQRAYSLLTIKNMDDEQRVITGMATTPTADRLQDVVEPKGARFTLPIPFLWQHDSGQPIGHVTDAKVGKAGIEIVAKIAKGVTAEIDRAWALIKAGLVPGLSIGFKAIEHEFIKETKGIRFIKWDFLELSAVTIPANAECTIATVKSIDTAQRAVSGQKADRVVDPNPPSVLGRTQPKPQEGVKMKTIAEQITALEAKRQASASRRDAVMQKAIEEDRTTDATEQEEFDNLDATVNAIDSDLVRLHSVEKSQAAAAKPVLKAGTDMVRSSIRVDTAQPKLPPGIAFARYVIAKAVSFKEMVPATEIARQRWPDHPDIELALKAAVAPGSSTTLSTLVQPTVMASELIEYLWHRTIVGRIQGLRRVPFNIKVPRQTSVASVSWVGEAAPKPLSAFALDTVTLGYYKIAGIVALTDEIIKFSSPSAEAMVRDELANAIVTLMDHDFIDPEKAAVAGISPASITNGVTPVAATGTAYANFAADLGATLANFDAARIDTSNLAIVMSSRIARSLGLMLNSLGQPLFPSISATGGTVQGYQVVVSGNVDPTGDVAANGDNIIFLKPDEIFLADDGNVSIDISREASVQMDSAPDNPALATTITISAFQHNLALIRAERYCNWLKRRAAAVQYISGAKYA